MLPFVSCLAVIGKHLGSRIAEEHNEKDSPMEQRRIKMPQLQPTTGIHIVEHNQLTSADEDKQEAVETSQSTSDVTAL